MIRLRVASRPDGALEASGLLSERLGFGYENGRAVCRSELASWRKSTNAKPLGLRFSATLTESSAERIELARA
jgi:hypothetical protein